MCEYCGKDTNLNEKGERRKENFASAVGTHGSCVRGACCFHSVPELVDVLLTEGKKGPSMILYIGTRTHTGLFGLRPQRPAYYKELPLRGIYPHGGLNLVVGRCCVATPV